MNLVSPKCPKCKKPATGTLEALQGVAVLIHHSDGKAEHDGTTNILWDTQKTIRHGLGVKLFCKDCSEIWVSHEKKRRQAITLYGFVPFSCQNCKHTFTREEADSLAGFDDDVTLCETVRSVYGIELTIGQVRKLADFITEPEP